MLEFLNDDQYHTIILVVLFVVGVMLYLIYRNVNNMSKEISKYNDCMEDLDYRIKNMNYKMNNLMDKLLNGILVEANEKEASKEDEEDDEEEESIDEEESSEKIPSSNIIEIVTSHIKEINYDGIEFSDLPELHDISQPESNATTIDTVDSEEETNTKKHTNIVKRILNNDSQDL
uniref:Uncharacterized protein n=1 Tax=viral metagenome TaxID=1070528 RepID=A0A6C0J265_9ZZZZ